jgi:hypothetical protein
MVHIYYSYNSIFGAKPMILALSVANPNPRAQDISIVYIVSVLIAI